MNRLTAAVLLATAFASQAAMAQSLYFNGGSGWLVRSTSARADLSFPDGGNTTEMEYYFSDGVLEGYQYGGSAFSPKNGRVQFSVISNGPDNARFDRVATAFSWAMDAWSGEYGWAAIPANRSGAMTERNPSNAPRLYASKIGDQFQMEVYASNYLTRFGWAQAQAKIRNAPTLNSDNNLTTTMSDLSLLDVDPTRMGVQVLPGNVPVHVTAGDNIVSRNLIDFGTMGSIASPFRDAFFRSSTLIALDSTTNAYRLFSSMPSADVTWSAGDATGQRTAPGSANDYLLRFTNADIGKHFDVRYRTSLKGLAYDADGTLAGEYDMGFDSTHSYMIEVIPAPGPVATAALGLLVAAGRRRRG